MAAKLELSLHESGRWDAVLTCDMEVGENVVGPATMEFYAAAPTIPQAAALVAQALEVWCKAHGIPLDQVGPLRLPVPADSLRQAEWAPGERTAGIRARGEDVLEQMMGPRLAEMACGGVVEVTEWKPGTEDSFGASGVVGADRSQIGGSGRSATAWGRRPARSSYRITPSA